jgi:protein O-mannosyl-transferase
MRSLMAGKSRYVIAAAVAAVTLVIYLPVLRNGFVLWDDNLYVYDNHRIRSLGMEFFHWAFTDIQTSGFWFPLVWISYAVDYALWGLNPLGYHLTNIVLHAANTFLVVLLVMRLMGSAGEGKKGGGASLLVSEQAIRITAGITGLLFGLHPLHVESVAWVSQRKDLVYALFFLLSMLAYCRYAAKRNGQGWTRMFHDSSYALSLVFFLLSLAGKSMAVTLPVVLLLLDWYPFGRIRSLRDAAAAAVEKMPFFLLSMVVAVISVAGQRIHGALSPLGSVDALTRLLVACKALILYLAKMLVPFGLLPVYLYPEGASALSGGTVAAVAIAGCVTAGCLIAAKRHPLWLSAWAYYVITLLPVIGIVPVGLHFMADRYTYLPGLGPFFLVGLAVAGASAGLGAEQGGGGAITRRALPVVVLALFIALSVLTVRQISIWENSLTLWNYVIQKSPRPIAVAYNNRGNTFKARGQVDRAIEDYTTAISLEKDPFTIYNNRGIAFQAAGRYDLAFDDFKAAMSLHPDDPVTYYNRGLLFKERGLPDRALEDLTTAIRLDPRYADAYASRGWLLAEQGETEKALEEYAKAIAAEPLHAGAYNNRGLLLQGNGQIDRAIGDFTRAVGIDPSFAAAFTNRALAYQQQGRSDRALDDYAKAIRTDPAYGNAYINRGLLLAEQGQLEKALADLDRAVLLQPGRADAYLNRGLVYEAQGRFDQAIADYGRAIERDRKDPLAFFNRGVAYGKAGQRDRAIEDHTRAIALDPNFIQAYRERGDLFKEAGDQRRALRDYQYACGQGDTAGCDALRALRRP